jgi:hypothetical protein
LKHGFKLREHRIVEEKLGTSMRATQARLVDACFLSHGPGSRGERGTRTPRLLQRRWDESGYNEEEADGDNEDGADGDALDTILTGMNTEVRGGGE